MINKELTEKTSTLIQHYNNTKQKIEEIKTEISELVLKEIENL